MKFFFSKLLILVLCSTAILPACRSASEKLIEAGEKARSDSSKIIAERTVVVSQSDLDSLEKIQTDLLDSWEKFKKESEIKIIKNEKSLVSLKASIGNRHLDMRVAYQKAFSDLRDKNEKLKERLAGFTDTRQEYLNAFKLRFNNDLNEVTKSLENIK